ncbi:MAG: ATP-dependent Clp protease proteolytic subunit [Coriobacteriia bacterium]|nr:ATP-dependent Clp protease proteolytic subunit [Coriobacteriia bacterium]
MNEAMFTAPCIVRETSSGLQSMGIRDHMLMNRQLELVGEVDAASVAGLIRSMLFLQAEDPAAPITLFINSPGGEVQSGLALYDVMQAVSCPVRTVCLGIAASMAALLFIAGEPGMRDMLPHSRVMIHDPLISGGLGGSALSVKSRADNLMRTREITAQVIAKHTGMSLEQVYELTAADTYFEAPDAVEANLADRIITTL